MKQNFFAISIPTTTASWQLVPGGLAHAKSLGQDLNINQSSLASRPAPQQRRPAAYERNQTSGRPSGQKASPSPEMAKKMTTLKEKGTRSSEPSVKADTVYERRQKS